MKNKIYFYLAISSILMASCSSEPSCNEGINLLPMYGETSKCEAQLQADKAFIQTSLKEFKDLKSAAEYYAKSGENYFNKQDDETAMKRFNQAWLLDSTNAKSYAGFGAILRVKYDYSSAISMYQKAIKYDPNNTKIYIGLAQTYQRLFTASKDTTALQQAISNAKSAIQLEKSAEGYGLLTELFLLKNNKDSASIYLKRADAIDQQEVDQNTRNDLNK